MLSINLSQIDILDALGRPLMQTSNAMWKDTRMLASNGIDCISAVTHLKKGAGWWWHRSGQLDEYANAQSESVEWKHLL